MNNHYDMIVMGGGPGGYTAALYAARAGLRVLVLEKLYAGGQMVQTHQIDNYPGFPDGVDGFTLAMNMQQQAHRFGAETITAEVTKLDLNATPKKVSTAQGDFYGLTLVIATGADPRPLGIAKEKDYLGQGIHYCAACDGNFYRGKTVAVVGGGNTAVGDALLLRRIAKKVILIHRRHSLRADKVYHQALLEADNVQIYWDHAVAGLREEGDLVGLELENVYTGEKTGIDCDGVFVSIGRIPATDLLEGQLDLDEQGYILTDPVTATKIPGVFAVGDVRHKSLRQVVTAVADGAMACHEAEKFLEAYL